MLGCIGTHSAEVEFTTPKRRAHIVTMCARRLKNLGLNCRPAVAEYYQPPEAGITSEFVYVERHDRRGTRLDRGQQ